MKTGEQLKLEGLQRAATKHAHDFLVIFLKVLVTFTWFVASAYLINLGKPWQQSIGMLIILLGFSYVLYASKYGG